MAEKTLVELTEAEIAVLDAARVLGRARIEHERNKSDPTVNGKTGRLLYEAEIAFSAAVSDLLQKM